MYGTHQKNKVIYNATTDFLSLILEIIELISFKCICFANHDNGFW